MNTSFSFVNQKNPFSEATHRFEKAMGRIDQTNFRDLREVMTALPHLRFRPGYTLDCCRVGDTTNFYRKLYVYRQDSEDYYRGLISFEAFETVPPIEDYLDIDFTPESVWEAVLLIKEGASYLEHGNDASVALVVDAESLIENTRNILKDYVINWWLDDDRIYPKVEMLKEDLAIVNYCRWGERQGLVHRTFLVSRHGRSVKIEVSTSERLESNPKNIILL